MDINLLQTLNQAIEAVLPLEWLLNHVLNRLIPSRTAKACYANPCTTIWGGDCGSFCNQHGEWFDKRHKAYYSWCGPDDPDCSCSTFRCTACEVYQIITNPSC